MQSTSDGIIPPTREACVYTKCLDTKSYTHTHSLYAQTQSHAGPIVGHFARSLATGAERSKP